MKEFTQEQLSTLSAFVDPERFSTGQSNRELHLKDVSAHQGTLPAGIVWPVTTEEVAKILSWTYAQEIPVTPWGAGTSTEGNPVPTLGGLVIDLTQMDKIIEIRPQDLQVDVQTGAVFLDFREVLVEVVVGVGDGIADARVVDVLDLRRDDADRQAHEQRAGPLVARL